MIARAIGHNCTWADGGNSLYMTSGLAISECPATGGEVSGLITNTKSSNWSFAGLSMLPGTGNRMLLTRGQAPRIHLFDTETKELRDLGISGANPVYAVSGHLLFAKPSEAQGAAIWAVPFSAASATVTGPPFPVTRSGAAPSVSRGGTLVHTDPTQTQILVRDRTGRLTGTLGSSQTNLLSFDISPDGKRIAMAIGGEGNSDIWIQETDRPVKNRFTTDAAHDVSPVWSPDGKWNAFSSEREGTNELYLQPVDGNKAAARMVKGKAGERQARNWSRDGRYLFIETPGEKSPYNVHYVTSDGAEKAFHPGHSTCGRPIRRRTGDFWRSRATNPVSDKFWCVRFPKAPGHGRYRRTGAGNQGGGETGVRSTSTTGRRCWRCRYRRSRHSPLARRWSLLRCRVSRLLRIRYPGMNRRRMGSLRCWNLRRCRRDRGLRFT